MVTKQRVLAGSVAAKSRRTSQSAPRGPSTATLSPAHCVQAQYSQRDKVSAGRKTGICLHSTVTTNNAKNALHDVRVRFHIIGNARIKNVYKYQSCMVTKLPIICEQTVDSPTANAALSKAAAASGSAVGFRRSPRHMRAIFSAAVKICR